MASKKILSPICDTPSDVNPQQIREYMGDTDNDTIQLLAKWASKQATAKSSYKDNEPTERSSAGATKQDMFDYIRVRLFKQYSELIDHSPVSTLNLTARLIQQTRSYLEAAHLRMHSLHIHQDGDYQRWARKALTKWSGPIYACLRLTETYKERLDVSLDILHSRTNLCHRLTSYQRAGKTFANCVTD
jgi:hypothetical protein